MSSTNNPQTYSLSEISDYEELLLEAFRKIHGEENYKKLRILLEIGSDKAVKIVNDFIEKHGEYLQTLIGDTFLEDYANLAKLTP